MIDVRRGPILVIALTLLAVAVPGVGGAPVPGTATPIAARTVTLADDGATLTLPVGAGFLLKLGAGEWSVRIADPEIVARVVNVLVVRGAQGLYVAKRPGRTLLTARDRTTGCPPSGTPCGLMERLVRVTLVVTASGERATPIRAATPLPTGNAPLPLSR